MTNAQIVAELGWTRKIIKDVTGVSPTTMRPPYGDIDDRVRAISLAMGMVPIIWTSKANPNGGDAIQWDSQGTCCRPGHHFLPLFRH
jgi:peptidoglycan/xylan/chitin deacetylase (PgdA/CDA1 family)